MLRDEINICDALDGSLSAIDLRTPDFNKADISMNREHLQLASLLSFRWWGASARISPVPSKTVSIVITFPALLAFIGISTAVSIDVVV